MEQCIHCNDQILHEAVVDDDKNRFCCNGCLQVYHMIHDQEGLDFYYTLLEAEKSSAPSAKHKKSKLLERLSEPGYIKNLGEFSGDMHSVSLFSNDIHCSACGWLLETVLKKKFEQLQVYVDFFRGTIDLSYDTTRYQLSDFLEYCKTFGYTFDALSKDHRSEVQVSRSLLIRLSISGAIFANVMIFSLGIYFGMFTGIESDWVELFTWYSLALSIPVVTYCAYPFYQKAFEGLRRGVLHMDLPVAIGIFFTFIVSLYLTITGYHGYFDSVSGLVFFLLIGRWGIQKFERSIVLDSRWFEGLKNDKVKRLSEEGIEDIPIEQIGAGEQVVVFPDEYIPIDGNLKTPLTWVDKSLLTGESAVEKMTAGTHLFAGYKNLKEKVVIEVTNVESKDRIEQLKKQFDAMIDEKNKNRDSIEKIVPWFILAVLFFAVLTFITHLESGIENALLFAASVLVVSCPCALALARPLNYGLALKRLSGIGIFSKKHAVLEQLMSIDTVLFDKTGTLTVTEREIDTWDWIEGIENDIKDSYYALLQSAVSQSFHPVSLSIKKSIHEYKNAFPFLVEVNDFTEIVGVGLHLTARIEDKEHELYLVSAKMMKPNFDFSTIGSVTHAEKLKEFNGINTFDREQSDSVLFINGTLVATIAFKDSVKPGVAKSIEYLKQKSIKTVLVSGDVNYQVSALQKVIPFDAVYGEQSPEDKLAVLQKYQKNGKVVAIGDGFNDSLFVASADVGIVVKGGADYLGEGADILLISPSFNRFSNLFHIAKRAGIGIRRCYIISILYNLFAISLALLGYISPLWAAILMPLSSLSITLVALFTIRYHD